MENNSLTKTAKNPTKIILKRNYQTKTKKFIWLKKKKKLTINSHNKNVLQQKKKWILEKKKKKKHFPLEKNRISEK